MVTVCTEPLIRAGLVREFFRATFPSGEGSDLAGVVEEVGAPLAIAPTLFGALPGGKAGIVPNQAPIGTRPAHPPRTQPRGWR